MDIKEKIVVEKISPRDEYYKVTFINYESGLHVNKNDLLLCFETSKATFEILANEEGYFHHILKINQNVRPGEEIAFIASGKKSEEYVVKRYFKENDQKGATEKFSKKAAALIAEKGLKFSDFDHLNFVKESDILLFIKRSTGSSKNYTTDFFEKNTFHKDSVIIIGAGGGGKVCYDLIKSEGKYSLYGFIDDNIEVGKEIYDLKVIGNIDSLIEISIKNKVKINVILAFGVINELKKRWSVYLMLKEANIAFPNCIHPTAFVESNAIIGEGNIVHAGAIISSNVQIGDLNYFNTGSIISHDIIIKNNNHFAPSSTIAGYCKIGNNCLIGMGVTTINMISIQDNVVVNNGVAVINDIQQGSIIYK